MQLKRNPSQDIIQFHLDMAINELGKIYPNFDPNDSHNIDTAKRISKMWIEQFRGLGEPDFNFTVFENESSYPNWVIKKDIEFSSMCFPNKTRIRTAEGVKFIKDIKVGDSILTFTNSGELVRKNVTALFKKKSDELISLKTKNGKKLECTPEHPIYVVDKGWVEAKNIHEHDKVYVLRNAKGFVRTNSSCNISYGKSLGYFREIDEVVDVKEKNKRGNKPFTVYNFEVEDEHTYIANDIWVHNCQHHFMPFFGKVHIGYVPDEKICGISKLDRVVDYFSKRPQVQERLGDDILGYLHDRLRPEKLIVVIESLHTCVACRGIESRNSSMLTFHSYDPKIVKEFAELIR